MTTAKAGSTNSLNRNFLTDCNLTYAVQLMGGRWKLPILTRLNKGKRRFSELKKVIPNITERMLTLQLRELERDGLISRTVYAEVPPRVEYELTVIGKELIPVCLQLHDWGAKHKLLHLGTESSLPL
ncbi:helix-turn-helix domain-containing protein [Hymenobacter sp. YC55]|uniref:winged helix-turn-helix transcriptional regulator n=1 Tax=Hymenobacter sp. YC55 TaxID=3034019 RepID=UPI0023F822E7|nr:helix-turn-helix domain-containing protein [Hymenobacter sp. YC55]MDF7814097.1 helix-turn-helix domain-containing protein [Hymenobacter sp. YC55]